ncbi:helix-turn-helix domain-containing protein [Acrocarpospora sp. B8E8]|uniref:ATP-binding protein n=1 Tax=Acrocarpospora sp. B8E8 TaxID=3153572 RepID=UPI00325E8D40
MSDLDEPDALATLLRRYRQVTGLSQRQLAESAGLGERTVRDLERGRVARPQQATIDCVADALGLGPADRALLRRSMANRRGGAAAGNGPLSRDSDPAPAPNPASGPVASAARIPDVLAGIAHWPARVPLPADPPDFSGRDAELHELARHLGNTGATTVVYGPPGIGKTSVIVRAARLPAATLPDGVFFVDLRGTADRATSVRGALAQLLTDLGMDRRRMPGGLAERRARYLERVADRGAVLVLDNALDAEQVRPLLPVGGDWRVLISSRRQLADLTGVQRLRLGGLSDEDARHLLVEMVHPARLAADPDATDELIQICGGLPLALRIAGSRLASRPGWTVGGLMDRLRDTHRRLDGLYAGDVEVRAAFTVSYRQLAPAPQAALRRLALLPWRAYNVSAVADVLDADPETATAVHAGIAEAGLLTPTAVDGQFRLHDLLVLFGQERVRDEDGPAEREAALERVRSRLLATAVVAASWFPSSRKPLMPYPFPQPRQVFDSARAALDWFEAERDAIAWAVRRTAEQHRAEEIVAAVEAVRGLADRHHHLAAWHELFRLAVYAARELDSPALEANLRNALGFALKYQARRPEEALPEHEQARRLYAEIGDRPGHAWSTLYTVGALHRSGRLPEALDRARLAATMFAEIVDEAGAAIAAYAIGDILRDMGRPAEAAQVHRRGLAELADPAGRHRVRAGMIGYRLGLDLAAAGDLAGAVEVLDRALAAFRAEHHPTGIAECLGALSEVLARLGSPRAVAVGTEAVRVCDEFGDLPRQAQAWYALGLAARAEGRMDDHSRCWERARALCEATDVEGRRLAEKLAQG